MASLSHDEERAPERTTPQGTQEAGVEHGHEAADMDFPQVGGWFLGLAATVIIAMVLLWATFKWWAGSATRNELMPSPLFTQRVRPPEPRILPNPIDYPETATTNPVAASPLYPETPPGERAREDKELQRLGLQDEKTGLPLLPPAAVAKVIAASQRAGGVAPAVAGPASTGLEELRPSRASGGLAMENQLR